MNSALKPFLDKYRLNSVSDYNNALKEIIQHLSLLALWRSKFYEKGAFYGGTALRIFYGVPRFSEDLDFSLIMPSSDFSLEPYINGIKNELEAFGFSVHAEKRIKKVKSGIESAFIKAETLENLLTIGIPENLSNRIQKNEVLKVKLEVDIDPPQFAEYEMRNVYIPIPFQVKLYTKESIFAGKIHALLCRNWKERVKGRDFYDFVWLAGQQIGCNLLHLKARLVQTGHFDNVESLDKAWLIKLLNDRFADVNYERAKDDVRPFIIDSASLDLWNKEFFMELARNIKTL
jgi:predicted nucleotidyltransferase component of viral defense system